MTILTVKSLKGKETDWNPTFRWTVEFQPGENLGHFGDPDSWNIKTLKSGVRKVSQTVWGAPGETQAEFSKHMHDWVSNQMGVKLS